MKKFDYDTWAQFYDALELEVGSYYGKSIGHATDFILKLAKTNKAETAIDFMAGTGRQAVALAKAGHRVTAVDLYPKMLDLAKRKARGIKSITFRVGDATKINLHMQADMALTMYNAIAHLSHPQMQKFVHNAKRHLKPGGVLVFDVYNFDYWKKAGRITPKRFKELTRSSDGVKLERYFKDSHIDKRTQVLSGVMEFHYTKGEKSRVQEQEFEQQLYSLSTLKKVLHGQGFSVEYRDIAGKKFSTLTSKSILCICTRN